MNNELNTGKQDNTEIQIPLPHSYKIIVQSFWASTGTIHINGADHLNKLHWHQCLIDTNVSLAKMENDSKILKQGEAEWIHIGAGYEIPEGYWNIN